MKTLFKNTIREIWQTKARFISIMIIVMLGVAIFVGVSSAGPIMEHTADQYYDATQLAELKALSTAGLADEDLDRLNQEVDGQVMGEYVEDAFIAESKLLSRVKSVPSTGQPELNQYIVQSGRLPEKEGEVALDAFDPVASQHQLGETIHFNTGDDSNLKFLKDQDYEVVGFVSSPLYIENGQRGRTNLAHGRIDAFALVSEESFDSDLYQAAYLTLDGQQHYDAYDEDYEAFLEQEAEQVEQLLSDQLASRLQTVREEAQAKIDQGYDELDQAEEELDQARQALDQAGLLSLPKEALPEPARQQVEDYEQAVEQFEAERSQAEADLKEAEDELDQLDQVEVRVSQRFDNAAYAGYGQNAQRIQAIAKVFPVFFFTVALLVSLTTMTRMVDEGRSEISSLKAMGYSHGAVSFKYLFYAFLAGFLGFSIGLVGYYIFPTIIYNAYGSLYSMPEVSLKVYWSYSLIALAGAMLATVGATLFALLSTIRTAPARLMQPKAPKKGKRILLERITPLWNALSFNYKITFRNLFRYKKRMFMTILGIAGCTALMLMGFGISDSVNALLYEQYGTIDQYDGTVRMKDEAAADQVDQLTQRMDESELVDDYLLVNAETTSSPLDGQADQTVSLLAPAEDSQIHNYKLLESAANGQILNLPEQGVLITEKLAEMKELSAGDSIQVESEDGSVYDFQIEGIVRNYMGHALYMNRDYYQAVTGKDWTADQAWLQFEASEENEDQLADRLMEEDASSAVIFTSTIAEQFEDTLGSLDGVVTLLIIAAALLAFVVLYNLTNVNIGERQRELATIKVLGFYDREVSMYILRENIFLTLFGILAGYVLGIFLHRYIILIVEFDDIMFGRSIDPSSYLWAALLTILFSLLVMLFMHFKLKKTDMVEALGEE